ncbi:MAG: peptidyl-prolyl cis-trans isomerase [Desulfuromonadales bacterium]|nr:peptidyl-prolyl cis-trans isomerase [Desulfuromonadales bacterium]
MRIRKNSLPIALLLLTLFLALGGCKEQQPTPPLVQIGDLEISLEQFREETGASLDAVSEQSAAEQQLLQRRLLAQLIDRELILREARRLQLQIEPEELETALADLRGAYSAEEFEEVLRTSGQNPERWRQQLKLRLLTEKVAEQVTAEVAEIAAEEASSYYQENREQFRRPAQLRARQILVTSREEAEAILARLDEGEAFAELAQEVSLSPDRENGGDLGFFAQNQLPKEFDEVLFKLPIGRVSEPVPSPYGFHLFLVEEKSRAGIEPFERIKVQLTERLHRERKERAFAEWLNELRLKTPVYIDWVQLQAEPRSK